MLGTSLSRELDHILEILISIALTDQRSYLSQIYLGRFNQCNSTLYFLEGKKFFSIYKCQDFLRDLTI